VLETAIVIGIVLAAAGVVGYGLYRSATRREECTGCTGCGPAHNETCRDGRDCGCDGP
jgi:hypothetical protein